MNKHPEYLPATAEEFGLVVDLESWKGRRVHVEGWAKGAQFIYRKTVEGVHFLRTPVGKQDYKTRARLLKTRQQQEEA